MAENGDISASVNGHEQPEQASTSTATANGTANGTQDTSYEGAFPTFPAMGGATTQKKTFNFGRTQGSLLGQTIKRHGASNVKVNLTVAANERKFPHTSASCNADIRRNVLSTQNATQTSIQYQILKNNDIKLTISGADAKKVDQAKNKVKVALASQETSKVSNIPKDLHRFILGKGGKQLRELEDKTGTRVRIPGPKDTDSTIEITGSRMGIANCKKAMNDIVAKSGNRDSAKIEVDKKYHPFIAGGHNKIKQQIEKACGNVVIHIPPSNKADATEISVVGEKEAVARAVEMIKSIYDLKLKANIEEVRFHIPKESHRHIIGPKYQGIQDILEHHDVIVEVPDQTDTTNEHITLRGEQANLGKALNEVYRMAHSHGEQKVQCPAWCMQKIIGKGGENIKKLNPYNSSDNFVRVTFVDKENHIIVAGKTETIEIVAKAINDEIKNIRKSFTVREIAIPQQFHGRIIGKAGANLKTLKGDRENLNIRVPDNSKKSEIIQIEGAPSDVQAVYKELALLAMDFKNEKEVVLKLESKYHAYFFRDNTGRDKGKKEEFEIIRNENGDQVNIQFPQKETGSDEVKIRGPSELVDNTAREVKRLYEQIVSEHFEGKILVAKKFHRNIIGQKGANINKIKDECNVNIDIPSNDSSNEVITIIGSKGNVEKAKAQIREIENSLAKISEAKVVISRNAYKFLIGRDGANITALREKHDVAIQFPDETDKSEEVTIRGEEPNVKAAKKELVEMANDKIENFHTEEIACPKENRKFLVGKAGATRTALQKELNCSINIPDRDEAKIQVIGKKADVQKAIKALAVKIKELSLLTEQEMTIAKKYHKRLITEKHLDNVKDEFGCTINMPSKDSESDTVKVKGPKTSVEPAIKKLSKLVDRFENESELEIELPTKDRRALIGEKGETIQRLQAENDVFITIKPLIKNKDEENEEEVTLAIIKGPQGNLEKVTEELKALVTYHEDYELPNEYHGLLLGKKGQNVQDLSKKLHITIKVPKKEDEAKDVIKLRGTTANLAKAKAELDNLKTEWKDQLEQQYLKSYTCPVDVPIVFHGKLIGPKGSNVQDIQKRHDVRINIQKEVETINITGFQENVHACVDEITKFVDDLESHVEKDVEIDSRCHYKIIGKGGAKLRSLMREWKVDIKMPARDVDEAKKNYITVGGSNDNVESAIIELFNLETEILADEGDEELPDQFKPSVPAQECFRESDKREQEKKQPKDRKKQQTPNWIAPKATSGSADAFPTLSGDSANNMSNMGAWGQKRPR